MNPHMKFWQRKQPSSGRYLWLKRGFDVIVAVFLLVLTAPVLLIIAVAIKLTSPSSILYKSERVGQHGKRFLLYKFRTMTTSSQIPRTSEKTYVGRALTNVSLDELPTLWNVLKGEMSLVGPRPEIPERVNLNDPAWQRILSVKPGVTGPALLTFLDQYNATGMSARQECELDYVQNQSFLFDMRLLLGTFQKVIRMGNIKGRI